MKKTALIIALAANLTYLPHMFAQSGLLTQEQKDEIVAIVGKEAGEALHTTHFAVNTLADNWRKNVYADFQAKELAAGYKGSVEQVLGLVKGKSPRIEKAVDSLLQQATVLETWIHTKEDGLASVYDKLKAETDATLLGDRASASAASGDDVATQIREIAEEIRLDLGKLAAYKPTREQISAIISTTVGAERMHDYVETGFAQIPSGRGAAKEGQTEILIQGPDFKDLPGGYTKTRDHFKPGIRIYGFKYVEPGKTLGMAYDALIKVDGQWIFIPKPWRVFSQANTSGN